MKYICCLFFFFSTLSLYNCTSQNSNDKLLETNQDSSLLINLERLDVDLYEYLQNPTKENETLFKNKYGDLLEAFGAVVINNSDVDKPEYFKTLQSYFSNASLSKIYKDELSIFNNIKPYNDELTTANLLIKENFGGKQLPSLAIHVSGFKENVIVTDSILSISADKYLGSDYPIYQSFFENYQLNQMQQKMIVRDLLKAWLLSDIPKNTTRKDLLSEVINEGKVLYALEILLPNWNQSDLIGYTDDQLNWAIANEKDIWNTTLQKKYLYSNDPQTINKYINDAPYTATISSDSPGRLGAWLGCQIVKSYMKNTGDSLGQLFEEDDPQKVLKLSKYNP